jgi:MFS family permease
MVNINMKILVCSIIAFTLTIDYSLSLISTQAYWISMGGQKGLSGLVFGLYDAPTILFTPLLAYYIAKGGSYGRMFMISLIINMFGNLLYALADYAETYVLIMLGRLVSGLGATCFPLIFVFIAEVMDEQEQVSAIGYTKYIAAISRMIGPLIGSLLTFSWNIPGTLGKLFNMYTLIGWIPIVFDIACIILLLCTSVFERPVFNGRDNFNLKIIMKAFWPILLIGFLTTTIYWMFMGNAFLIATHHYHIINNEHDLKNIYITGFVGFIGAFIMFMCCRKTMSGMKCFVSSNILLYLGSCIFFFTGDWAFYFAVGITTFAYGVMIPSLMIMNNIIGKRLTNSIGSYVAIALTFITIFQGLARFCGPAIFTSFTNTIQDHDCDFKNKDAYVTSGCELENYYLQNSIFIAIAAFLSLFAIHVLKKNGDRSVAPESQDAIGNDPETGATNQYYQRE